METGFVTLSVKTLSSGECKMRQDGMSDIALIAFVCLQKIVADDVVALFGEVCMVPCDGQQMYQRCLFDDVGQDSMDCPGSEENSAAGRTVILPKTLGKNPSRMDPYW